MPYGCDNRRISEGEEGAGVPRFFHVFMERTESLLIGGYKIIQDDALYRFTSDAVLLARFLKAKRGERVADFCAGSGVVGLHFYAENKGVEEVVLVEAQSELAEMSARTVALNRLEGVFEVVNSPVQALPARFVEHFSLILCNPPYEKDGFESPQRSRAEGRKELLLRFGELCAAAARALKFGGRFALVHRADRVAEVLSVLREHRLEPKKLQFVAGRAGKKPYAVLVAAVKGGKEGVEVLPERRNEEEER